MSADRNRVANVLPFMMAIGALASCGSSRSSSPTTGSARPLAPGCRAATPTDQTLQTNAHVFLLHVGPPEQMAMPSASKNSNAEEMLGGSMATMPATPGTTQHHLEVHICDRATGKVVAGAMPAIALTPSSGAPERVPVMVMQGIKAGPGDLHYGNNVPMRARVNYTIGVRLGTDRVVFHYELPSCA